MSEASPWRTLPYFEDPASMQAFTAAEIIYGRDRATGRLVLLHAGRIERLGADARFSRTPAELVVPFDRDHGELEMLRAACVELKGRDDYHESEEDGGLS